MASSFALYRNADQKLYFYYAADFLEGLSQDSVKGPSLEKFAIQPIYAFGCFLVYHPTAGLRRTVLRGAFASYLSHHQSLSFAEAKDDLLPFLLSSLREGLQLPDPKTNPVFSLGVIATPKEEIFEFLSDGTVLVHPDAYFSSKAAEAECRGASETLSEEIVKKNMSAAAMAYYDGTRMDRIGIRGQVSLGSYPMSNYRGEDWGLVRLDGEGKEPAFLCVYP